jgi:aryl-alcohol dehydrogenase-like predicted oxidoreductase
LGVRFALSRPEMSCALVGVSDQAQLEEAVQAAEAGPLPPDAVERIVEIARGQPDTMLA